MLYYSYLNDWYELHMFYEVTMLSITCVRLLPVALMVMLPQELTYKIFTTMVIRLMRVLPSAPALTFIVAVAFTNIYVYIYICILCIYIYF